MKSRKLAGYSILTGIALLFFSAVADDVGWERALTVAGATGAISGAIILAVWLIVE